MKLSEFKRIIARLRLEGNNVKSAKCADFNWKEL